MGPRTLPEVLDGSGDLLELWDGLGDHPRGLRRVRDSRGGQGLVDGPSKGA